MTTTISSDIGESVQDNSIGNILNNEEGEEAPRSSGEGISTEGLSGTFSSEFRPSASETMMVYSLRRSIQNCVDELFDEIEEFHEIDRNLFVKKCMQLFTDLSQEELHKLTKMELKNRIEKIGWVEVTAGMLSDLSEEERERYDQAKSRRPLFS